MHQVHCHCTIVHHENRPQSLGKHGVSIFALSNAFMIIARAQMSHQGLFSEFPPVNVTLRNEKWPTRVFVSGVWAGADQASDQVAGEAPSQLRSVTK